MDPTPSLLDTLAHEAGVPSRWMDYIDREHTVSEASMRRVLRALGLDNESDDEIRRSLAKLQAARSAPPLLTAIVGERVRLPLSPADLDAVDALDLHGVMILESGETTSLAVVVDGDALAFDAGDRPGYHDVQIDTAGTSRKFGLAVAPRRAYAMAEGRCWGTAVQLYSLRADADRGGLDTGAGDYSGLARFAAAAGRAGAQALAVSPTHAAFSAEPSRFSPYSPSSRLFHNVLYVDPVAEFGRDVARAGAVAAGIVDELAALSRAEQIDWERSGRAKLRWLRAIFDAEGPEVADVDDGLRAHAIFETLHQHFVARGLTHWRAWPEDLRDARSTAVAEFAAEHATEVRFHTWLQGLAAAALDRAQAAARGAGMRIGLIADMAVGMSPDGSHAWCAPGQVLRGLEIGAPPDLMNRDGQSWGLVTFSPAGLVEAGYAPFIATLRAAMRHAGGVRIDHVLGLKRLWLVPDGLPASKGAYVNYPFDDLLNLIVLESHRQRAIVIGEDLGTVPAGLRDVLADRNLLGMSVLWFERTEDDGGFIPSAEWRVAAVAMTTTHDLPTAAGWWQARDIEWQHRLGHATDMQAAHDIRERERSALRSLAPTDDPEADGIDLAIDIVARAASPLAIVPIEDLLGLPEQPNLPGTIDEHPNWRQRLPVVGDRLFEDAGVRRRVGRLNAARPG